MIVHPKGLHSFFRAYGTLSIVTNKLNQIAKRVNQTGVIYKSDIDDMKKSIEEFSKEVWDIHSLLLKRKK